MQSKTEEERWAVIDIGSDTVHLLVAAVKANDGAKPGLERVLSRSILLELGRDVADDGRIDPASLVGLEETVSKFVRQARREAKHLVLAATEATRRASNGPQVLEDLSRRVDEPIRVLSGRREAQLGFEGVRSSLKGSGCQLVVDSGGASTEVSIAQGREYVTGVSLPIGAALLASRLVGDPPTALSWALLGADIAAAITELPPMQPTRAWATGGSAHHLAALDALEAASPKRLRTSDLNDLGIDLLRFPAKKLAEQRKQDPRRVALLPAGVLILGAILDHYRLDRCTVLPAGLREGILQAAFENPMGWWQEQSAPLS